MALFYPELMVKGRLSPMSPFVATGWNLKDIKEYQRVEGGRRHIANVSLASCWQQASRGTEA